MTPQELKNSILQLAIQGKLVEQRAEEGTGKELLEKILAAKNAESAKGRGNKLTRSRGVRGGGEEGELTKLPEAAKSHHGKVSALSASPREEIPDDEKPFEIPESWEWVRLIDCGEFISGFTPSPKDLCGKGIIPYFKVADMNVIGNELWMQEAKLFLKSTSPKKYFFKHSIGKNERKCYFLLKIFCGIRKKQ